MDDNSLPINAFDQLLDKLATVLQVSRDQEDIAGGNLTPQAKQKLLQATNDFKDAMARAQKLAAMLPGGDIPPEEQDDVIAALEELRDRKRAHLQSFAGLLEQVKSAPISDANGTNAQ